MEVSFRPCLTRCNQKTELVIPPLWVQLDYVFIVIHEYLLKQTGTFENEDIFSHRNIPTLGCMNGFCVECGHISI